MAGVEERTEFKAQKPGIFLGSFKNPVQFGNNHGISRDKEKKVMKALPVCSVTKLTLSLEQCDISKGFVWLIAVFRVS